ncbi:hypothetical protein V6N11_020973 [Hibiscus sabdariffa]|uniref:Uncharacterized protein n=2 Tax=Hibiscus sabdariffa TaxID=183260 RepID=A0ABR2G3T4_9ROSI
MFVAPVSTTVGPWNAPSPLTCSPSHPGPSTTLHLQCNIIVRHGARFEDSTKTPLCYLFLAFSVAIRHQGMRLRLSPCSRDQGEQNPSDR